MTISTPLSADALPDNWGQIAMAELYELEKAIITGSAAPHAVIWAVPVVDALGQLLDEAAAAIPPTEQLASEEDQMPVSDLEYFSWSALSDAAKNMRRIATHLRTASDIARPTQSDPNSVEEPLPTTLIDAARDHLGQAATKPADARLDALGQVLPEAVIALGHLSDTVWQLGTRRYTTPDHLASSRATYGALLTDVGDLTRIAKHEVCVAIGYLDGLWAAPPTPPTTSSADLLPNPLLAPPPNPSASI
jgi:hypothetical protein